MLSARGVRMKVSVPPNKLLRIEMAPESLRLLLHLLIENSLDWMSDSSPAIEVTLTSDDDTVSLSYADNGKGIPPGLGEKVFDPCFSLKEGGQGLGLTIARNLVRSHGGTIELVADSRRRRGAAFRVTLPRKRSRATRDLSQ